MLSKISINRKVGGVRFFAAKTCGSVDLKHAIRVVFSLCVFSIFVVFVKLWSISFHYFLSSDQKNVEE